MTDEQRQAAIDFLRTEMRKHLVPKVLVIEDDPNDLFLLERELKKFNCEVVATHDGETAIQLINNNGFNIVFLDLRLRIVDGVEVIQKTKHLNPDMHFAVLTGSRDIHSMNGALKEGAVMIFDKPVTFSQLAEILKPKGA